MSSIIANMLSSLFPKNEFRILMLGLDAAGKTTVLYRLKLGEVVTTIPTIGFNVETLEYEGTNLTMWDVGGCDKIRPLWKHYYQNTQAMIMVVDSNDRDRLGIDDADDREWYNTAKGMLNVTLREDELRDAVVLVYFNKQDLPNAMKEDELVERLGINTLRREGRLIVTQPCHAPSGEGLYEGIGKLVEILKHPDRKISQRTEPLPPAPEKKKSKEEELMEQWMTRVDEPDDEFLQKLMDYTLDSWDHYTHLRIAWLMLSRFGRREGMALIFQCLRNFIANSPLTKRSDTSRGTTFHETMTYFWAHMVHYAMVATKLPGDKPDFKTFLVMNPRLVDGGLFLGYYSKKRMLMEAESRSQVVLPDLKPLPSLIPSENGVGAAPAKLSEEAEGRLKVMLRNPSTLSDRAYLQLALLKRLPSWGHKLKLRVLYVGLLIHGRQKGGVDRVLDILQGIEKDGYNLTLTYFWVQMLTYCMMQQMKNAKLPKNSFGALTDGSVSMMGAPSDSEVMSTILDEAMTFETFLKYEHGVDLEDQLLYQEYFSSTRLQDEAIATALHLPDLKPYPSSL